MQYTFVWGKLHRNVYQVRRIVVQRLFPLRNVVGIRLDLLDCSLGPGTRTEIKNSTNAAVPGYKALSGSGRALPGAVCPISRSDLSVQSGSPSVEHQSSSHGRPETRIKQVAQYLHCSGSWYELSRDIQYVSRNIRIVSVRSVQSITACKLVNWHLSRRD